MEFSSDFINKINNCNFFSRCGEKDTFEFEVEYVKSPKEVKKHINSIKWENTCHEISEDFSNFICMQYINCNEWNSLVCSVKSEYIEKLCNKVKKMWIDEETSEDIWIDIRCNLIALFMLDYCTEYYKSEFYDQLLEIYLSGHIACGWKGKYPKGKFLVY